MLMTRHKVNYDLLTRILIRGMYILAVVVMVYSCLRAYHDIF